MLQHCAEAQNAREKAVASLVNALWQTVVLIMALVIVIIALENRDLGEKHNRNESDNPAPDQDNQRPLNRALRLFESHIAQQRSTSNQDRANSKTSKILGYATFAVVALYTGLTYKQWQTTRESFTAVQRAFVTMDDPLVEKSLGPDPAIAHLFVTEAWTIKPVIRNSGNTPAKEVRWRSISTSGPSPIGLEPGQAIRITNPPVGRETWADTWDLPPDPEFDETEFNSGPLGPQRSIPIGGVSAPKAAIRDAMRAKRAWYIYGIVYYYDVFPGSPRHKTKFCFSISLTRTGPNTDTDTKIVTSACAHWNCADDECDEDSKQYETDVRSAFQQKKMAIPPEILTAPPPPKHKWTGVANPPPGEPAWP
jgi:hypothetical protein